MHRALQIFLSISVIAMMSGCGGDDANGSVAAAPTPTPASSPTSIGAAIDAAIAAGDLPTLDTSTSVTGSDANANGIRDDIDSYISRLTDAEAGKAALRQYAGAIQSTLTVDTSDANALATLSQRISASVQCVFSQYPEENAVGRVEEIEKYTVNTRERFLAYAKYNDAINGSVILSAEGTGCAQ